MSIVKITARIGKDISEEIIVDEKDYQHSCFDDILENEEYYLKKRMGKKYGQSVDETEWEEIKEKKNERLYS